MQGEYPQPGVLRAAAPAAVAATAAAAGAKLAADVAAQSRPSNATGGISRIVGDDDGKSDMVPPSNTSAGNGTGRINGADQVTAAPSLPARLMQNARTIFPFLPYRGPIKRDPRDPEDYATTDGGLSEVKSRFTAATSAAGGGATSAAGRSMAAGTSEAVSRPQPNEPPKNKEEMEAEKRNRSLWRAVKLAGLIGAGFLLRNAWKSWVNSKKKKTENPPKRKRRYDEDGRPIYDDYEEDEEYEDEMDSHEEHQQRDAELYSSPNVNVLRLPPPRTSRFGGSIAVPQGEAYIIERSGRFHRKATGGSTFLMPFRDKVAFRHSLREIGLHLDPMDRPHTCYTRDGVPIDVIAMMYVRIEDPVEASYSVEDLYMAIMLVGISSLKREVSNVGMKDLLTKREAMCERVANKANQSCRPWGVRCVRFEMVDIVLPPDMQQTLEREAHAERMKNADILHSEGQRQALINKADAEMQAQMRMSQARQMDIVNQAIGEAHAIQERGEAIANAMRDVAQVVAEPGGEQAMRLRLADQYLEACRRTNNGTGHQDPAQVVEAMNNAFGLLNTLGDPNANVANPYVAPHHRQPQTVPNPPTPPRTQYYPHGTEIVDGEDDEDNEGGTEMMGGTTHGLPASPQYGNRRRYEDDDEEEDDDEGEEDDDYERQMNDYDVGMQRTDDRNVPNFYGARRPPPSAGPSYTQNAAATYSDGRESSRASSADYEAMMRSPRKPASYNDARYQQPPTNRSRRRVTIAENS